MQATFVHYDIVHHIACHSLTFCEVIRLRRVNRELKNILDERFFRALAVHMYGFEFWQRARTRPPESYKSTKSTFKELLRIEQFQRTLESRGEPRWTNDMFFRVWESVDRQFLETKTIWHVIDNVY